MFWYDNLCIGTSVARGHRILIYKINHRKLHPMVYLLALNSDSSSVLEIIPSSCFLQKNYPTDGLRIIGICGNRREAKEMCRSLIEEVWREQGDFDLASYWERRQKKEQQT